MSEVKVFENRTDLASNFSQLLKSKINSSNEVNIALSGGSTPKAIFDLMAEKNDDSIRWSNVHFYWGDERCVPPTDSESNYKMTVDHLLSKIQIPSENIHRIMGENDPEHEAIRYADEITTNLKAKNGIPQFDLIILGMGNDGHTASIFPYNIDLWSDERLCVTARHPDSGQIRISFTGKLINNASEVAFLITGEGKRDKVFEVVKEEKGANQYPASLVKPQSGNLKWYLDQEAASRLE